MNTIKPKKTQINANSGHNRAHIKIILHTRRILTPSEKLHEQKALNDCIFEALHKFGFHRQDIIATSIR